MSGALLWNQEGKHLIWKLPTIVRDNINWYLYSKILSLCIMELIIEVSISIKPVYTIKNNCVDPSLQLENRRIFSILINLWGRFRFKYFIKYSILQLFRIVSSFICNYFWKLQGYKLITTDQPNCCCVR